ncbi:hypothetical protein NUU61_004274 [Penicillium alfredii]|uniref:Cyanovirin-N domain-containing protein n=1 Tax=Penicillium alfredii TaxID=1506179 RepID=A0A9W9FL94_9EURO|nr:uncharacterized protein NUU61_004274 [Penicillium alfredii]KAJ5102052.1 hypothetical protein NUU61_004274 [Penicillium alfredii]
MVKVNFASLSLFISLAAASGWMDTCKNEDLSPEGAVTASCSKGKDAGWNDGASIDLTKNCFKWDPASGKSTIYHGGDGLKGCRKFEIIQVPQATPILQAECDIPSNVQNSNQTTGSVRIEWNNDLLSNQGGNLGC